MEYKDYQQTVLDTLDIYLTELKVRKHKADKVELLRRENPELEIPLPDFCGDTWNEMRSRGLLPPARNSIPHSARRDGVGRYVPSICCKVPVGGGKTLIATAAVQKVFTHLFNSNTGFVVWVVPNEAIYTQTKRQLTNREHPYRQLLDKASAGRVKILEKSDPLDARDVESHLCVMLLMLQSAARETKETLRFFRDRGNVRGFFPVADDFEAHHALLSLIPNLSAYSNQDRANLGSIVQDSLGNVLRLIRPMVIIDEGHKAYSARAMATVYDFNPSFVLELSGTPRDRLSDTPPTYANWLVDVHGRDLEREDMIKLPINLTVKAGDDWRDCLRESLDLLKRLQADADALHANEATYIRPIMLVQVERTGKEQRESGFIHAEDARDYLKTLGLADAEIAVKSAEVNDLKNPENQDLLSATNRVRVVITKAALQEGWDCPFAYVLCSLAANSNISAMTQLVGRVLRQPYARKTDVESLDQCYVLCHHASTRDVISHIKKALEQDGMGDLVDQIREDKGTSGAGITKQVLKRRAKFDKVEIYLPTVKWSDGEEVRDLDYDQDILSAIEWDRIDVAPLADGIKSGAHLEKTQVTRITFAGVASNELLNTVSIQVEDVAEFDPVYATRVVSDIVPNPWVARAIVGRFFARLAERGLEPKVVAAMSSYLLEELRKHLLQERDKLAEAHFLSRVADGAIQFRLRADGENWRLPHTIVSDLPEGSPRLRRNSDELIQSSVLEPVFEAEFNNDEQDVACYIDEQAALVWWHRNVAKAGHYHVQGWRKGKVYPDFLFGLKESNGVHKVMVVETKGDQLAGSDDTEYKRKLLDLMTGHFQHDRSVKAGELELVVGGQTKVICDMVLISDWKSKFPHYFN